jgi:hypothetical protein
MFDDMFKKSQNFENKIIICKKKKTSKQKTPTNISKIQIQVHDTDKE